MKHFAFITGTADFLNLYSYLIHRALTADPIAVVLFGNSRNISEDLTEATRHLVEVLPDASFDFLDLDLGEEGLQAIKDARCPESSRVGLLLITHVFGKFETIIMDAFDHEELVLVENGLATYFPPVGRDPQLEQSYFQARPARPVHEAWLPLAPVIGCPFYVPEAAVSFPSVEAFRSAARELADWVSMEPLGLLPGEKVMFVAGTSLYRLKVISHEGETACYRRFISEAFAAGYDRICWKPHPRMMLDAGGLSADEDRFIMFSDSLPFEFRFLEAPPEAGCASVASSAIFLGAHYFGIEPMLIPAEFDRVERYPHLSGLNRLVGSLRE